MRPARCRALIAAPSGPEPTAPAWLPPSADDPIRADDDPDADGSRSTTTRNGIPRGSARQRERSDGPVVPSCPVEPGDRRVGGQIDRQACTGLEQLDDLCRRHRPPEVVTLAALTAEGAQSAHLVCRLDPFGGDAEAERRREGKGRLDDRGIGPRLAELGHERAVDLELLDREALEVLERREAGPKVIDSQSDTQR